MLQAARRPRRYPLSTAALGQLTCFSCVCKHWAAAAQLAVQQAVCEGAQVRLPSSWHDRANTLPPAAVASRILRTLAAHWQQLDLHPGGDLICTAGFANFLHSSCPGVTSLVLRERSEATGELASPLSLAYLEAAAAALPNLERLTCKGFLPVRGVSTGLECLVVEAPDCKVGDLEILLLHCAHPASRLREISLLQLHGDNITLRAISLRGVLLPRLERFSLQLICCATADELDLSWLARTARPFCLDLSLADNTCNTPDEEYVRILQGLQGVLREGDSFTFEPGPCPLGLAGQRALSALQLGSLTLHLPLQTLELLPAASEILLKFHLYTLGAARGTRAEAAVSWSALVSAPGTLAISHTIVQQGVLSTLHVSGCPVGSRLPGSVSVHDFDEVTGL